MENNVNNNSSKKLVPYLILHELADVDSFKKMTEEEGIDIALQWRYYYGYNDAIRTINFVETKGVYDAWAVLLPKDCQEKADKILKQNPAILKYFEPAEERFFRGLKTADLKKALASQQMNGRSLELALKILKEEGFTYPNNEIQALKEALVLENTKKASNTGRTKVLIWGFIILVIVAYLGLVGMFE
ncbi:MAG: hypothetical protein ACI976_000169 [Aureispira sp.]|jgi:hypothetical protein